MKAKVFKMAIINRLMTETVKCYFCRLWAKKTVNIEFQINKRVMLFHLKIKNFINNNIHRISSSNSINNFRLQLLKT